MNDRRRNRSRPQASATELPYDEPKNTDGSHPVFCLKHLHRDFDLKESAMTKEAKAAFAESLQSLSGLTWKDLRRAPKHGLGFEKLPTTKLRMTMPDAFSESSEVFVFRYSGKLPMAGVRAGATFHILAIERQYGDLYNHGS
ncbi:hypothetical protein CMS2450 [Clavibacter sepedonicus]|uniref:Uncharacterized protein n=2 Tax=Microbacteriaceae TaxID=85023 RepID=B0RH54_CLASE|nr:hypothetical protein CMS2450 [Clavibacter sepedonicus]